MGKCKFNTRWLDNIDCNNDKLSVYINCKDDYNVLCSVCSKIINVERGCFSIYQHARGEKHKENIRRKKENHEISINTSMVAITGGKEASLKAEVIWTLKAIISNYSFASADNIKEVFQLMFNCEVAKNFTMSAKKMKYLITCAIEPHFKELFLRDLEGKFIIIFSCC